MKRFWVYDDARDKQHRTTRDLNLIKDDLQNLKYKIGSESVSPVVVLIHYYDRFPENIFKSVFSGYSKICFHDSISYLHDLLYTIQRQKKREIVYEIRNILGRQIDIYFGTTLFEQIRQCSDLPFQTEYELCVKENNARIKVKSFSENNYAHFLSGNKTFKIPSKIQNYNKNLNAVGIDFGTSECCAFVIRRNGPESVVLDDFTAKRTLPSYVSILDLNQPCGQNIVNRMEINPAFYAFDVKRLIGKEFHEIIIDPLWTFSVLNYCEQIYFLFDDKIQFPKILSAAYITNYLLEEIKRKVEEFQGLFLDGVVLTVPSSFTEKQKQGIIHASDIAGCGVPHLLPEPIAALITEKKNKIWTLPFFSVIAYSYETDIPNGSITLLFDLGGGTTDICISKIVENEIKVLMGDQFLGGKDFDKLLINHFNSILKERYELDVFATNKKFRLMLKCQEIKHTLSVNTDDK
uniref:Uncharacterized protein n=1 Tax=Panagrolaimus davidi TaxID=227884 RepID=A0A914QUS1_9BILA